MNQVAKSVDAADDYTMSFIVEATPERVYATINDVRSWWLGDIAGRSEHVGDEFAYRYEDLHRSTQKVTELVPGKRVVWEVTDAHLSHSAEPEDWTGTKVVFDIIPSGELTEVRFTHEGLRPAMPCYDNCVLGWQHYAGAVLPKMIEVRAR
jgi:activator of Hsp90 ATPase-like protein